MRFTAAPGVCALVVGIAGPVWGQQEPVDVRRSLNAAAEALGRGGGVEALRALGPLDAVEPKNPWLWFFRGRAHHQMGHAVRAWQAYDRALDELEALGDPEPELAAAIRAARRLAVKGSIQLGLAYDSNVTFRGGGISSDLISGRGDGKFASQWQWEVSPIVTPREALTLGGRVSNAWHFSIEDFNYQDYGATFRYARRIDERWSWELQYDYDVTYLDNQPFLSNHALSPRLGYRWRTSDRRLAPITTRLDYRIEARDFLFTTEPSFDRDGSVNSIGVSQQFRLASLNRSDPPWDITAEYRLSSVATEGSEFDRVTHGFFLSLLIPTTNPWLDNRKLDVRFLAGFELADYRNGSLLDGRRRERDDRITTLGVTLSQQLVSKPEGEVILHAIFNWTDYDSNVRGRDRSTPFSYDKIVAGVQLEWRF